MFNLEQLPINKTFSLLPGHATASDVITVLEQGRAAILYASPGDRQQEFALALPRDTVLLRELFRDIGQQPVSERLSALGYRSSAIACDEIQLESETLMTACAGDNGRPLLLLDAGGSLLGYLTIAELLTWSLREQRRWQAYFGALADTVSDAVTVVDRNGEVICWNAVAEDIYHLPGSDILGRRIGEHFEQDTLMVLRILDEGRQIRNTYHRPREDTHVLINASPIRDENGAIIGGIAAEQDITQLVKLNEQLSSAHAFSHAQRVEGGGLFSFAKGKGPAIGRVMQWAKKVAAADTPVLIIGEGGSGKEQLAQMIHGSSPRADEAFLTANCGIVPSGLLETELFGFQGGAFSGSDAGQAGKLELARDGTLFLNEIDRLSSELQAKLFHYLSQRTIQRIGGSKSIAVRTRIIAASTSDLAEKVREGEFRADLYYALNIVSISLPPLRERREDIPAMLQMYLKQFSLQYQKPLPVPSPEVLLAFANYDWPGNILELRNVVERCVILCDEDAITIEHLPPSLQAELPSLESLEPALPTNPPATAERERERERDRERQGGATRTASALSKPLKASTSASEEQRLIEDALIKTAGNKSAAAKLLGVSRGTLYNKMNELGLE